jgi:hypothetical protein
MASENRDGGYDRIAGALANLGYEISDQTVGNVLQRHGLPPAPDRHREGPVRCRERLGGLLRYYHQEVA